MIEPITASPIRLHVDLVDVHDGDTITIRRNVGFRTHHADTDLGFGLAVFAQHEVQELHIRFYGINAPELITPEGVAARDGLITMLGTTTQLDLIPYVVGTHYAQEKYGRWLADVFLPGGLVSLNTLMVQHGWAVPYFGGPR